MHRAKQSALNAAIAATEPAFFSFAKYGDAEFL